MKQYDRKISRLTLKITRNPEDADDALQDAFLKAYANLRFFQGDSRFYTWLARIAVNEALTRLRRHNTHRTISLEDDGAPRDLADYTENPEQTCVKTERRKILSEAMQELEPALRLVLTLRYLEDFSSEEIARRLNLTVPAVKSRLMRARLKLRHRLHRHFKNIDN
jgi:RNA polymerase sigma-70 factor (ECF subfamily)